jgi:TonB family protein
MNLSVNFFATCLIISIGALAVSQTVRESATPPLPTIADFGLSYPLPNDWVRATEMFRGNVQTGKPLNFDVLLAAVYIPGQNVSTNSPSFSLRAYRQPATDCKQSLEAMIAHPEQTKVHAEGGVTHFSAAGRDYFRVNLAHGPLGRHECIICTTAGGHLLVWSAGALTDKGLDLIASTLNSITALPPPNVAETSQPVPAEKSEAPSIPSAGTRERINVPSGTMAAYLVKKGKLFYPEEAKLAGIQGTVVMRAQISKTGDVTYLELLDGPIALAGAAVSSVRQWKFKPYLQNGEPVEVTTRVTVDYSLWR